MSYLYCYRGQHVSRSSFHDEMSKTPELECPFNIGASARLMVAFSGFNESHEPPPLGDARGTVPPHRNGHQNGQQSEYMMHHR